MAKTIDQSGENVLQSPERRELLEVSLDAAAVQVGVRLSSLLAGFAAGATTLVAGLREATAEHKGDRFKAEDRNPTPAEFSWVTQLYRMDGCKIDSNPRNGKNFANLPREIEYVVFYFSTNWCSACNSLIEQSRNQRKPGNVFFVPMYHPDLEMQCDDFTNEYGQQVNYQSDVLRASMEKHLRNYRTMGAEGIYTGSSMFWNTRKKDSFPAALVLDRDYKIVDKPDFGEYPAEVKDFWGHVLRKAKVLRAKKKIR